MHEEVEARVLETAGTAPLAGRPPLWARACPRPGSYPAAVSTGAWERERARVGGGGRGQMATEMFAFCHGKSLALKYPKSYPTTHSQHVAGSGGFWSPKLSHFWCLGPVAASHLLLKAKAQVDTGAVRLPQAAATRRSPLVRSPLLAPGRPVAASQARARGQGGSAASPPKTNSMSMLHSATLHLPLGPPHPPAFTIVT